VIRAIDGTHPDRENLLASGNRVSPTAFYRHGRRSSVG
jgi:hypothetical protein